MFFPAGQNPLSPPSRHAEEHMMHTLAVMATCFSCHPISQPTHSLGQSQPIQEAAEYIRWYTVVAQNGHGGFDTVGLISSILSCYAHTTMLPPLLALFSRQEVGHPFLIKNIQHRHTAPHSHLASPGLHPLNHHRHLQRARCTGLPGVQGCFVLYWTLRHTPAALCRLPIHTAQPSTWALPARP